MAEIILQIFRAKTKILKTKAEPLLLDMILVK